MWRKICHVEKFQISMRDKCGEIWNLSICGVISHFAIWKMWRNLKIFHIWHVCEEEDVSTCVKFMLFCCKLGFVAIYSLCRNFFVAICTLLYWDKLTTNCVCEEKWQISGLGATYNITVLQSEICCSTAINTKII